MLRTLHVPVQRTAWASRSLAFSKSCWARTPCRRDIDGAAHVVGRTWRSSTAAASTVWEPAAQQADDACAGSSLEENGSVRVTDDLDALLKALPEDIREPLMNHPQRNKLLEVVLDLGRRPEARFLGVPGGQYLREAEVTARDLRDAEAAVGDFGRDNRAGVAGTLHRISAIRNRREQVIGLTCRVGRAVSGHADLIRDLVESNKSVLLLGKPGVGKTTVVREIARLLSGEMKRRVVIVDTSNEIGGDGDVPHPAIGSARRMQVPDPSRQHHVMIEAVENHTPEVIIVDEIGSEAEALACRTIAERGITLIGTAHGRVLENLMQNPTLCDLIGGIESVTLGDETARARGTKKTVLERKAPPTFPIVVEIRDRCFYVAHWTQDSVDALLHNQVPTVQVRERDPFTGAVKVQQVKYDQVSEPRDPQQPLGQSKYSADFESALAQRQELEAAAAAAAAAAERARVAEASTAAEAAAAASTAPGRSEQGGSLFSDSEEEEEANNALPFSLKELVTVASSSSGGGSSSASGGWASSSYGDSAGAPAASSSGRGFGPSSFAKPQVSPVMAGSGKQAGGGKRSKGKASARKASR